MCADAAHADVRLDAGIVFTWWQLWRLNRSKRCVEWRIAGILLFKETRDKRTHAAAEAHRRFYGNRKWLLDEQRRRKSRAES